MSQTLLTATNFPQFIRSPRSIVISSDDLNNSNFIINQFIQALAKGSNHSMQLASPTKNSGGKVFGVFLNQSYTSYSFIQMKCGNNLKNLKELNQFRCLDVISDLEQFLQQGDCEFNFIKFKAVLIGQLMDFFQLSNSDADSNADSTTRVLIIDDITTLLSLNVRLNELANLTSFLRHFCSIHNISLIVQTYADAARFDEAAKLNTYLNSIADLVLITSKLETGYSNKVDGNLKVKNYITNTELNYLFKSTERTTKLFSPGTI